ncbi:TIGR00180 family glycosyltransferase [uncultured Pseudodesulfovibrio sp.]|uniref:TIGR00180 family glycosyltransferase n=1 Tax=uncultured Pseudodesulfovibrio sp. TaxID=2035858 RepID=UPI0029C95E09|nr:TIGR00180 family glycosyltransferase [uncultured Pseudodesulfovibrio sp.]
MKKRVTVVIPTHERHHLLEKRVLPHYLSFGIPILVIDSSPNPYQPAIDNPNIDYIHCPGEPFPHKMKSPVLKHVKTPYMFMNADDTVNSKTAIRKCLAFLEKEQDFSSVMGLVFQCRKNNIKAIDCSNHIFLDFPVTSDKAGERMLQAFVKFNTTFYAVTRTECWHEILKRLPQEIVNYYLTETYVDMMMAAHGKHATLPLFYAATEAGPSINDQDPRFHCSPFKLATERRYAGEVTATKKAVTQFIQELSGLSEEHAANYTNGALALYWLQDKPIKSLGDRIRIEWTHFLNKTFQKSAYKKQKAEKKAVLVEKQQIGTQMSFELIGQSGREECKQLVSIIQNS